MSSLEVMLCVMAVLCSSVSQLFIKGASTRKLPFHSIIFYAVGATLLICSVLVAVIVLKTLSLSSLVQFAALAYVLVPIGSHFSFGEGLSSSFWLGASLIIMGILIANL